MKTSDFCNRHFVSIVICVFSAVAAGIGFYFFPWIADDLMYRLPFAPYFNGETSSFDFAEIWRCYVDRYLNDNGRMASLAMYVLQFLPDLVNALISTAAYYYTLRLMLALAGLKDSPVAAFAFAAAFAFILPWTDQMYLFDFQLPYLVGGAMALWYIYSLLNRKYSSACIWAMSLFIGLWQESFGFPIFLSMLNLMLFYPEYRDKRNIIASVIVLAGLVFLYTAPGRARYQVGDGVFHTRYNIVFVYIIPALIYLAFAIVKLIKTLVRRQRPCPEDIFIMTACAASAALSAYAAFGPRVGWLSGILAIPGIVSICKSWIASRRWLKITSTIVAYLAFALFVVHICLVDYYAYIQKREYDSIINQYRSNPDEIIYSEMTLRHQVPLLCFQKPYFGIFSHYYHLRVFTLFYGAGEHFMRVAPIELKDYDSALARPIGSDGFTIWRGHIVGPKVSDIPIQYNLSADYGNGYADCRFLAMPFTDPQGVERAWFSADVSSLTNLFTPLPIDIIDNNTGEE